MTTDSCSVVSMGMSMDMAKYLKEQNLSGCFIVLGPQEPPMEYYQNLISFVSNTSACEHAAKYSILTIAVTTKDLQQ